MIDSYSKSEIIWLFQKIAGHQLEVIVKLATFYGLRAGEILGLRWDAINFEKNPFTVYHTIIAVCVDGKTIEQAVDRTKSVAGRHTFPLTSGFRSLLVELKAHQMRNQQKYGDRYSTQYLDYVCVNQYGERMKLYELHRLFKRFLDENELRRLPFHALRKSCHGLLIEAQIAEEQRIEWMRLSREAVFTSIYLHQKAVTKRKPVDALLAVFPAEIGLA